MRTYLLLGLITTGLVATTTTSPRAQGANVMVMTAPLTGGAEAPTAINTGAYGFATITLDRSAGEVSWVIDVFNLPTGIILGHIHAGSPGTAGPIIIDFNPQNIGQSGSFRLTGSSRTVIPRPAVGIRTMEEAMFSISAGATYVNLHTQVNPGGEIRGQLCPTDPSANIFTGIAVCKAQ
jgi:hypothetical protein